MAKFSEETEMDEINPTLSNGEITACSEGTEILDKAWLT